MLTGRIDLGGLCYVGAWAAVDAVGVKLAWDAQLLQKGQQRKRRWQGRFLLVAAGLATALLASACDTAQQVPWATYSSGLQPRIDAATVTGNCATLQALLTAAKNTTHAHEKATGFPNDALVSYIQASQARAGCPAGSG